MDHSEGRAGGMALECALKNECSLEAVDRGVW